MSKTNVIGISIDTDRMINDLIAEFLQAVDTTADDLLNQMKSRVTSSKVHSSLKKEIVMNGLSQIEIAVGSSHWKAFLDNYGTGSKMADESKNPYLSEYKNSQYWHNRRPSSHVTAREQGSYTVPDWEGGSGEETRVSNGNFPAGTNLEKVNTKSYNAKFIPSYPTFFLENSMRFIEKVFQQRLSDVYKNFNFSKYISGGV